MISKETADRLMDIAYDQWLFEFNNRTHLREPSEQLRAQLKDALSKNDNARVSELVERLLALGDKFSQTQQSSKSHEYETAETHLHCGWASYKSGDKKDAIEHWRRAAQLYAPNSHYQAIAYWMLGCVNWQLPTMLNDAIYSWELSYEFFERALDRASKERADRYQNRLDGIKKALEWAVEGKLDLPFPNEIWEKLEGESATSNKSSSKSETAPSSKGSPSSTYSSNDVLRSFAVYASIPAGGFASSPNPLTRIETDHVCIDRVDHYVRNLHQGQIINLRDTEHYVVVKVKGDSMDLKGIKDGDYVLLRVQEVADNGDIVVFEINSALGEGESTLKQFFKRDGKIILQPQSNNPQHQPFEFTENTLDFHVRGVALAVLKKAT